MRICKELILTSACDFCGCEVRDIGSKLRLNSVIKGRSAVAGLARWLGMSFPEISELIGRPREKHSTGHTAEWRYRTQWTEQDRTDLQSLYIARIQLQDYNKSIDYNIIDQIPPGCIDRAKVASAFRIGITALASSQPTNDAQEELKAASLQAMRNAHKSVIQAVAFSQ